ncbi:MAG: hypothetical protein KTQ49_05835 [Candidatus Omnitrophica bacterium]|nr:hypothetical protein [Candidatus Omnitrophota bacterium]
MRGGLTGLVLVFMLCLPTSFSFAAEEPGYFTQLGRTFGRGFKNVVSSPWELPYTIGQYDRGTANYRVFRDTAGFVDGLGRVVTRCSSGIWDVVFSLVPGAQDGILLEPETFF